MPLPNALGPSIFGVLKCPARKRPSVLSGTVRIENAYAWLSEYKAKGFLFEQR